MPSASSSAALANSTEPSPCSTATSVANKSNDWKRDAAATTAGVPETSAESVGRFKALFRCGVRGHTSEFAPDARDIALVAQQAGLEFSDPGQVFL